MSNVSVCDDNDNNGDVKEGSIMSETAKCGVCGAGKFGREAVAAAGGAEGDAFRRKLAEYDARVLKGRVGGVEFDRPMLGLKPRRVAEDERLAEVLDAMARYVKAGLDVPGEWRDELEELLAWRGSRFSKQRPWERFPEPAKPNVPQSEAESSKPTSTGLLVGPAGCGTCVSGWDEGISSGMVLCARRSVRNGRFYICGDYNRMSYAELDERMDRKFCGEQVKPNATRTEADCT